MNEKSVTSRYIECLNKNILPYLAYDELQKSYGADMFYAKGVLKLLHDSMIKIYGSEQLDESNSDEGFVIIPGVVRGKESGKICVALLELDLSSSGEHWNTIFLCSHGVVSQSDIGKDPAADKVLREIGAYDYCYTAKIPCDFHVNNARLPDELKSILKDFRNSKAVSHGDKPSVLEEIREGADAPADKTGAKSKTKTKTRPEH